MIGFKHKVVNVQKGDEEMKNRLKKVRTIGKCYTFLALTTCTLFGASKDIKAMMRGTTGTGKASSFSQGRSMGSGSRATGGSLGNLPPTPPKRGSSFFATSFFGHNLGIKPGEKVDLSKFSLGGSDKGSAGGPIPHKEVRTEVYSYYSTTDKIRKGIKKGPTTPLGGGKVSRDPRRYGVAIPDGELSRMISGALNGRIDGSGSEEGRLQRVEIVRRSLE